MRRIGDFLGVPAGHREVPGLAFFGFWGQKQIPDGSEKGFKPVWNGLAAEVVIKPIFAFDGNSLVVEVWIKRWPSDDIWRRAVEAMLQLMIAQGAIVSWCGGDKCSWSLSELNPATSSGCIYAASSKNTGLMLHSGLSEEDSYLTDGDLVRLRGVLQAI